MCAHIVVKVLGQKNNLSSLLLVVLIVSVVLLLYYGITNDPAVLLDVGVFGEDLNYRRIIWILDDVLRRPIFMRQRSK